MEGLRRDDVAAPGGNLLRGKMEHHHRALEMKCGHVPLKVNRAKGTLDAREEKLWCCGNEGNDLRRRLRRL
jgi:hypothetical protein